MKSARRCALGWTVLLLIGVWGCTDPDRAIFERLDAASETRFRRGRAVAVPCWTCHDIAGTVKKVGPSLLGLHGRRSGTAPGSQASDALRGAAIVWDDRTLAAFVRDPAGFIPGNRMVSPGVQDPAALADLLFYLEIVTQPGARASRAPSDHWPTLGSGEEASGDDRDAQ